MLQSLAKTVVVGKDDCSAELFIVMLARKNLAQASVLSVVIGVLQNLKRLWTSRPSIPRPVRRVKETHVFGHPARSRDARGRVTADAHFLDAAVRKFGRSSRIAFLRREHGHGD